MSRPVLRPISKVPFQHVQLPKFDLPAGMTWGATEPLTSGYERFYNHSIRSLLNLPKTWHTYESELKVQDKVMARFVISSVEDPLAQGFFNSGVTLTLFEPKDSKQVEFIGESLRQNTLKEMSASMGGSTNWQHYGPDMSICSLRYAAKMPEIKFGSRTAKNEEMVFIQDITLERRRGLVFLMKFETPKSLFSKEMEETFRQIKTGGYFVVDQDLEDESKHENGFVFLQL